MYIGVDAIGNRDVDQPVLAAQRNSGLCALPCQRIQTLARTAAQNQRQHFFRRHRWSSRAFAQYRAAWSKSIPSLFVIYYFLFTIFYLLFSICYFLLFSICRFVVRV